MIRELPRALAALCLLAITVVAMVRPTAGADPGAAPAAAVGPASPPLPRRADFADFDRRATGGERLRVVFFGASLTWGANATDPMLTSYRAVVARRLEEAYPRAHFRFHDAAIGGTGSQLGVFRLERDVLRHGPDLVFLDFSANDDIGSAAPETLASYEAIVRRIVTEGRAPVVQVIFPFQWNVQRGNLAGMPRRDAHLAISAAYHTAAGDAIELAQRRVKAGAVTVKDLWPSDGVHPGNRGYELFADAAWDAFRKAVADQVACSAPERMLHATTYTAAARVRLSSLGPAPEGWRVGTPNLTSAFFDMLMSRWLDDELIAANEPGGKDGSPRRQPARLRARFVGSMVMLFGECTAQSGKYRVFLDGKVVPRQAGDGKVLGEEFDAGDFARRCGGNVHLVQVLAEGLDPTAEHTLEIEPALAPDAGQELRIESICVAGGKATVSRAP